MRVTERERKGGWEEKRKEGRCVDGEGVPIREKEKEKESVFRERYLSVMRTFNTPQRWTDSTQLL